MADEEIGAGQVNVAADEVLRADAARDAIVSARRQANALPYRKPLVRRTLVDAKSLRSPDTLARNDRDGRHRVIAVVSPAGNDAVRRRFLESGIDNMFRIIILLLLNIIVLVYNNTVV